MFFREDKIDLFEEIRHVEVCDEPGDLEVASREPLDLDGGTYLCRNGDTGPKAT